MVGDYLIIAVSEGSDRATVLSDELRRLAVKCGQTTSTLSPTAWLSGPAGRQLQRTRVGSWLLIGDVLRRQHSLLVAASSNDRSMEERRLMARFWGRYVGIKLSGGGEVTAVLRDPSGARECIAWSQQGLTFIGSTAPAWLLNRLTPDWSVNIERMAQAMVDPLMSTGTLMLDGPVAIDPGVVQPLPLDWPATIIWRPSDIAWRSLSNWKTDPAVDLLRSAVDEAVTGLAILPGDLAVEISGGLDSSIVAASVGADRKEEVRLWLNAYGATPEADERAYVDALGGVLGISPVSVPHFTGKLTEVLLARISQGVRPGLNALDVHHDLDWSARLTEVGADALLTGKGGDSILLHSAGAQIAADRWRHQGWTGLFSGDVLRLAGNNEMSVWTLLGAARRAKDKAPDRPRLDEAFLRAAPKLGPIHPWLRDCEAYGPAKIFQIAGVVDSVSRHGGSLLTDVIDVRHPLCAQPVIEAGLAIPTPLLTLGGRSRGLARLAFRDRLPAMITERRTKGDMTAIYGRMVFDNLPVFRSWLLDGRLVAEGIIDRTRADGLLTRESLMWHGGAHTLIRAAAFEGWLRTWTERLKSR